MIKAQKQFLPWQLHFSENADRHHFPDLNLLSGGTWEIVLSLLVVPIPVPNSLCVQKCKNAKAQRQRQLCKSTNVQMDNCARLQKFNCARVQKHKGKIDCARDQKYNSTRIQKHKWKIVQECKISTVQENKSPKAQRKNRLYKSTIVEECKICTFVLANAGGGVCFLGAERKFVRGRKRSHLRCTPLRY